MSGHDACASSGPVGSIGAVKQQQDETNALLMAFLLCCKVAG